MEIRNYLKTEEKPKGEADFNHDSHILQQIKSFKEFGVMAHVEQYL